MFATYFDRRFFEVQEFIYHFNKTIALANKNFSLLLPKCEQLQAFSKRKDEKRLSEEMRDHIKRLYELRTSESFPAVVSSSSLKQLNTARTSSKTSSMQNTASKPVTKSASLT